jgi:hypothetical protein
MVDFAAGAQRTPASKDQLIATMIESYFASIPGHQPGDVISRSQIEKAIAEVESAGVKLHDAESVAKLGLADDSFLFRELSTPSGQRFMRKLSQHPGTFARLDRLSTISRGETLVRDLIRMKDGDKMIEYLATTKGGQNMGNMMAKARGGVNLNKPTGRIYTADDLIVALKDAAAKKSP